VKVFGFKQHIKEMGSLRDEQKKRKEDMGKLGHQQGGKGGGGKGIIREAKGV